MNHRKTGIRTILSTCLMVGSVIADPPRERHEETPVPTASARLIAGRADSLRDGIDSGTVATGSGPRVRIKPVQIVQGQGSIAGDTISLHGGAAILKFDILFGGWGSTGSGLTIFQATTGPLPNNTGSGSPLDRPHNACVNNAACIALFVANGTPGDIKCSDYFTGQCNNFWQETATHPDWPGAGTPMVFNIPGASATIWSMGAATSNPPLPDDGTEKYAGTFVVASDTGARGTYTLTADPADIGGNFMQTADGTIFAYAKVISAKVTIPTGSCCFNLGPNTQCQDNVTQHECETTHIGQSIFRAATSCPPAGPGCCDCLHDGTCNDNDACTLDSCNMACQCERALRPNFDPNTQCCNNATGVVTTPSDDGDPCTVDRCVGSCHSGNLYPATACGTAGHVPAADGTSCDDDRLCTAFDGCENGVCVGTLIADAEVQCSTHQECRDLTGTTNAFCNLGLCDCAECSFPGHADLACDDADPCTYDRCSQDSLCVHLEEPSSGDPPTRACCHDDGTCDDVQAACCTSRGGTPRVTGSTCLGDVNNDSVDDACNPIIPAASQWGLLILSLSLLVLTKVAFGFPRGKRRADAA